MKKINYSFECLWGNYIFNCEFNQEIVNYEVETTIENLSNKQGTLEGEDAKKFNDLIALANIPSWVNDELLNIEDATKWSIRYITESIEYEISGEEAGWPYNYDKFIEAVLLCDDKATVLKIEGE